MRIDVSNIETVTRADLNLVGLTSTEVSDLLSMIHMGLDIAKSKATSMSGPSKKARERLIATGTLVATQLDKLEDQMNNLPTSA